MQKIVFGLVILNKEHKGANKTLFLLKFNKEKNVNYQDTNV